MKKLLSLLSVVTITGTAIPTTTAASPYQKEKIINSEINYSQINNLENINRNKRQNRYNNNFSKWEGTLKINKNDKNKEYESNIAEIITFLLNENIIETVFESPVPPTSFQFSINRNIEENNYKKYFIIPVTVNVDENEVYNLELIFRSRDFYLQGFRVNDVYYHFRIELGNNNNDDLVLYPRGNVNVQNVDLGFSGDYTSLRVSTGLQSFNWQTIIDSFKTIINYGLNYRTTRNNNLLRPALGAAILVTAESLRFRGIFNFISNVLINDTSNRLFNWETNIKDIVTNWDTNSVQMFNNYRQGNNISDPLNVVRILSLNGAKEFYDKCRQLYSSNQRPSRNINNLQNFCNSLNNTWIKDIKDNKIFKIMPLRLYYNVKDKNDIVYENYFDWSNNGNPSKHHIIYSLNLGKINPLDFDKINIFYSDINEINTKISWGSTPYYGTKITDFFQDKKMKNIIKNVKVEDTNDDVDKYSIYNLKYVDGKTDDSAEGLMAWIKIGLTWYWESENDNYYLQLLIHNQAEKWWPHTQGGGFWLSIGKGIILYND